jgi:hypothetical protein
MAISDMEHRVIYDGTVYISSKVLLEVPKGYRKKYFYEYIKQSGNKENMEEK